MPVDPARLAALPRSNGLVDPVTGLSRCSTLEELAGELRLRAAALQREWDALDPGHSLSPVLAPEALLLWRAAEELSPAPPPDASDLDVLEVLLSEQRPALSVLPSSARSDLLAAVRLHAAVLTGSSAS